MEDGVGSIAVNALMTGFGLVEAVFGLLLIYLAAVSLVRRFARV